MTTRGKSIRPWASVDASPTMADDETSSEGAVRASGFYVSTREGATSLRVLIVDEDVELARATGRALRRASEEIVYVRTVVSLDDAPIAMRATHFDVMLVNVDGAVPPFDEARLDHALTIAASFGDTAVIAHGHDPSANTAAEVCSRGAQDYLCVDGAPDAFLLRMLHCASQRARRTHQLMADVYRDELTGLANRRLLRRRFAEARYRATRHGEQVALLMIDLDGFKAINDALGHATGDAVLIDFAVRIAATVRESDLVARIGGDEFVVLACCPPDGAIVEDLIARITSCLRDPVVVGQHEIHVRASIGAALSQPHQGCDLETMLEVADSAMYSHKVRART